MLRIEELIKKQYAYTYKGLGVYHFGETSDELSNAIRSHLRVFCGDNLSYMTCSTTIEEIGAHMSYKGVVLIDIDLFIKFAHTPSQTTIDYIGDYIKSFIEEL